VNERPQENVRREHTTRRKGRQDENLNEENAQGKDGAKPQENAREITTARSKTAARSSAYPRTLIRENDSTARDDIGRPIDMAGRNVVKISILLTCGRSSWDSPGSERIL
jgi:hypothetical protein